MQKKQKAVTKEETKLIYWIKLKFSLFYVMCVKAK